MVSQPETEQSQRLLTAVERILDDPGNLIALANGFLAKARQKQLADETAVLTAASEMAIAHYSNRTAVSGGAAALPALMPGFGSLVAITGGALADMGLLLKFEVEMMMVLSQIHGFDISRAEERQMAFLLASVSTYEAKSGGNFLIDAAHAEGVAIWNYTPRQVSKLLLTVLGRIALMQAGKNLVRALPVVGIAVGASVNKLLTRNVGRRCIKVLGARIAAQGAGEAHDEVQAHVKAS